MTKNRLIRNVALLVGAFLLAQYIVSSIFNLAFDSVEQAVGQLSGLDGGIFANWFGSIVVDAILALGFAVGVFVSLRFVRPVSATSSWKSTILRGVVATAFGAVGIFLIRLLQTLLGSVKIGPYPFGYSFTASFNGNNAQFGLINALLVLVNPFISDVAIVVLACVFLKLWLKAHPNFDATLESADTSAPSTTH